MKSSCFAAAATWMAMGFFLPATLASADDMSPPVPIPCAPDAFRASRDDVEISTVKDVVTVRWKGADRKGVTLQLREPVALKETVRRVAARVRNAGDGPLKVTFVFTTELGASFSYSTDGQLEKEWRRLDTPVVGVPSPKRSISWNDINFFPNPPYQLSAIRFTPDETAAGSTWGVDLKGIEAECVPRDQIPDYWVVLPDFPAHGGPYTDFSGAPSLWADRLVAKPGHYRIALTAASILNGPAVWSDTRDLDYDTVDSFVSSPLDLPKGFYWVKARVFASNGKYVSESSFRVDVERRANAAELPREPPALAHILHISSSRADNLFAFDEMPVITVHVPEKAEGKLRLHYEVVDFAGRSVLPPAEQSVVPGEAVPLPLTQQLLHPGEVYRVKTSLAQEGRLRDKADATFGIRAPDAILAKEPPPLKLAPFPGPLFMAPVQYWGPMRWGGTHQPVEAFQELIDLAVKKGFSCMSIGVSWEAIEPLPGVYRFEDLDELVARVKKAGLKVFIEFDGEPAWAASLSRLSDGEGQVHNLWYVDPISLAPSPSDSRYLTHLQKIWKNLAAHFASDTDVVGYTFLGLFSDHFYARARGPGLTAQTDFQNWLKQKQNGSLESLNQAWGTNWKDWSSVKIPRWRDASNSGPPDFRPEWVDYAAFKNDVYENYVRTIVDAVRSQDGKAWVQVYWMGGNVDNKQVLNYLQQRGGLTGDGGSESEDLSRASAVMPLRQMREITESIQQMPRNRFNVDMLFTPLYYGGLGANFRFLWNMDITGSNDVEKKKDWLDCIDYAAAEWKPVLDEMQSARTPELDLGILDGGEQNAGDFVNANASHFWTSTGVWHLLVKTHFFPKILDPYSLPDSLAGLKCLWILPDFQILTGEQISQLKDWVNAGGFLAATPASGRWQTGQPGQDFALLHQLGLDLKQEAGRISDRQISISPGEFFKKNVTLPLLDFGWDGRRNSEKFTAAGETQTLAAFSDGSPAIVSFASGKGRVLVFLANINWNDVVPTGGDLAGDGFLDDIAKSAGAHRYFTCDRADFLISLSFIGSKKYLLVHRTAPWGKIHEVPTSYNLAQPGENATVRLLSPGAGNGSWRVTSMKGPSVDRICLAGELSEKGLTIPGMRLGETRVFRLEETP